MAGLVVLFGRDETGRALGERLAAWNEPLAVRFDRSLGFVAPIIDAVRDGVPEQATLAVLGADSRRNQLAAVPVATLLWPRRLIDEAGLPSAVGPLYVLTLGETPSFPGKERGDRIARNRRFELWRIAAPRKEGE